MSIEPDRVKALFQAAIDLEARDGGELRDRLEALLDAYNVPSTALDGPLGVEPEATTAADPDAAGAASPPSPIPTDAGADAERTGPGPRSGEARCPSEASSSVGTSSAARSTRGAWAASTSPSRPAPSAARWR